MMFEVGCSREFTAVVYTAVSSQLPGAYATINCEFTDVYTAVNSTMIAVRIPSRAIQP